MARIRLSSFIVLIVAVFTVSCSQYRLITIENQHPAKVQIPEEIQSLTLMNRSMTSQFVNFNEDSLQRYFYRKEFSVKTNVLDSLASDTCLQAIGDLLYESGRFDIVIPVDRNIPRDSKFYIIDQPLEWSFVDSICKTYKTDALLVMEKYVNRVNSDFQAEVDQEFPNGQTRYAWFYATFDIIYDAFFRLYYPEKKEITSQMFITDTIFWENGDVDQRRLFQNLSSIKKGIIDVGIKVALDLDGNISPSWVPEQRGIFVIDKKNQDEQKLISESNWEQLTTYWQPFTENKNRNIRSKAEFNMALSSELDGRIDDAITWATKSFLTSFRNQTDLYIKKLKSRKSELEEIERNRKKDQQNW